MRLRTGLLALGSLLLMLAGSLFVLAQDPLPPGAPQGADQNAEDPPGRAARLSFIAGNVSWQPGSVEEWAQAALNHPLTIGDRLFVEEGGRAELALGTAAIRLNSRTAFSFLNLDDQTSQIQVSQGTVSVRLRRLDENEVFEIDTPQVAFTLTRPGEYRIDVSENGDATIVTVRGGEGEITAGGEAFPIYARQQIRVAGTDQVAYDRRDMPPADVFDNWCADRDRREDRSISAQYVSRDIPGYADLDDNGTWENSSDYGPVWTPRGISAEWAPYQTGHWAWVAPWGWTWVDDAPWGYAPFHYGRWASWHSRWVWVPGPVVARPYYSPALVAWVGGGGFSVGVGIGPAVGWFPLGPREVFYPGYRYSPRYIERVNLTNTVIVDRRAFLGSPVGSVTYVNRNVRGGVTVVRQETFVSARPVREGFVRVSPDVIRRGEVVRVAAFAPTRSAVFSGRAVVRTAPSVTVVNRTVVARRPPPARPVSFERQQVELRQNPGRPIDRSSYQRIQQAQPAVRPPVRVVEQPRRVDRPQGTFNPGDNRQGGPRPGDNRPGDNRGRPNFPQQPQQPQVQQPQPQQQGSPRNFPQGDPRQRTDRPGDNRPGDNRGRPNFPQQPQVQQPSVQQTPQPQQQGTPRQFPQGDQRRTDRPNLPQQQQQPPVQQPQVQQPPQQQPQRERGRERNFPPPQQQQQPQVQQPQRQATPPPVQQPRVQPPPVQQQPPPQQPRVQQPPPQQPRPQPQQQQQQQRQEHREQKQRDDKKDKKQ